MAMFQQGGGTPLTGMLQNFLQAKQQTQTQKLMGPAMAGSPEAMQRLMQVNPQAGMQMQQYMGQQQAAQAKAAQAQQAQEMKAQEMAIKQQELALKQQKEAREAVRGNYMMQDGAIYDISSGSPVRVAGDDPGAKEFLKEERGVVRTDVKNLKKRASEINEAFGKVEGLYKEMKKPGGSRQANAAAIMSVARLISPGVVTDRDAAAIAGAANPYQAFADVLVERGEGDSVRELQKAFDPTNPKYFDPDGLLDIAKAVTSAEAPVILQQLGETRQRGEASGIKQDRLDAMLTGVESIESLSRFVDQVTEPEAPAVKPAAEMTDEELMAEIQALSGGQ